MLIPVGNLNDKSRNQRKSRWCQTEGLVSSTRPPPWRERDEAGGGGEGGERGGSFVKGISIHTAKYQENSFQKTGAGSLAMCLWVSVCFSLWVVAVFTGWMVDKAFKELSASGASSSSSVKAACPARKSGLPTLSSILSQEQ